MLGQCKSQMLLLQRTCASARLARRSAFSHRRCISAAVVATELRCRSCCHWIRSSPCVVMADVARPRWRSGEIVAGAVTVDCGCNTVTLSPLPPLSINEVDMAPVLAEANVSDSSFACRVTRATWRLCCCRSSQRSLRRSRSLAANSRSARAVAVSAVARWIFCSSTVCCASRSSR